MPRAPQILRSGPPRRHPHDHAVVPAVVGADHIHVGPQPRVAFQIPVRRFEIEIGPVDTRVFDLPNGGVGRAGRGANNGARRSKQCAPAGV